LVGAKKTKEMSKVKREPGRRYPSDAAAAAEAARRTANQVIMNVLNQAGSSNNQLENMEVNPGNASVTYMNFHSEGAADGAHPLHPPSGRYDSIKIQRSIRGEHAASGTGPKVDRFTCGSFYNDGPAPILRADLQEDSAELLISTTSFSRMDWVCLGCESGHKLLPKKRNKSQWTKGRKLVILSDQNMPASLPSKSDLCPAIIRVEGGLLCELGDLFFSLLKDFTLPEGSVLLIGSLTHLMEEGLVGYARKMGAEFRRFSKLFDYTVHVVPFLPPPLGGTNDPDLVSNSYHIMTWLEHVQKWNLSGYYNMLRHFLTTSAAEEDFQQQKTQRYLMPSSYELFGDYVLMCHPIPGFGGSLPRMCVENEKVLVNGLLKELNIIFKWNLDTDPPSLRELGKSSDLLLQAPVNHTDAIVIGGSNGKRLHEAMNDLGMRVNGLTSGGWTLSRAAVDSLLPILEEQLAYLPESVPIILYLLDNSCFKAINENGDLVAITRSEVDGLFHVLGDLAVTPYILLRSSLQELDRLIAACGNRHILILGALPRFFLKTCCDNLAHCANISAHDESQVEAGKKFMQDLEDLNSQLAARLNSRNVQFVFTGDIISGKNRCSIGDLADCLYTCWRSDPVHGDKSAYMKIAVGLLDFLTPPPRNNSGNSQRKRSREETSPTPSRSLDRDNGDRGERGGRDRERHPPERREDPRSRSAYNNYPSGFRGGRGRGGGGGHRRFF